MKYSWVLLSLLLALITASGALMLKYIGINYKNDSDTSLIIGLLVALLAGCLALFILCLKRRKVLSICKEINNNRKPIKYIIPVLAVIFIINVSLTIYVLNKVENPAYAQMIKNTNVVFILLLSILIFKTKINKNSIMGVLLCVLGICVIIYNN